MVSAERLALRGSAVAVLLPQRLRSYSDIASVEGPASQAKQIRAVAEKSRKRPNAKPIQIDS